MRRLAECALAYQRGVGAWAREVSRLPLHGTHWGLRIQLRAFGWAWREILQYGCHTLRGQDCVPLRTEQRRRNGFRKERDPCMGGSATRRHGVRCHDLGHRLACFDGPPRPPAISLYLGALHGIALHWRCQWRVALRHKVNAAGRELVCGKGARAREWCALLARVAIDRCILGFPIWPTISPSRFSARMGCSGPQESTLVCYFLRWLGASALCFFLSCRRMSRRFVACPSSCSSSFVFSS